jgi:hypothetical protein
MPPGVPTVLIGGLPAATLGNLCTCVGPPDTIILGSAGVLIGGKPAARMGDQCAHGGMVVMGCPTVLIGEVSGGGGGSVSAMPVNVLLDKMIMNTAKGSSQSVALKNAAWSGKVFCEDCEKAKQDQAKKTEAKKISKDETPINKVQEEDKKVVVSFGGNAKKNAVSTKSLQILEEIGSKTKNYKIHITSTARTVADQARIMFNNCKKNGTDEQMKTYKAPGRQVIQVYIDLSIAKKSEDEIRQAMADKIEEVGPENVSKHIADPAKMNTFDIAQSTLHKKLDFKSESSKSNNINRILDENGCYHIEIPQ